MPILRRASVVLLLAVLAASCDSDDPLGVSSRTAQLFIAAPGANVLAFDVYEVYQDPDADGPDDIDGDGVPDVYLFCQQRGVNVASSVPWHFRIEVLITSSDGGTTTRITSNLALSDEERNRALYDQAFPPGSDPTNIGAAPQNPTGIVPPVVINSGGVQRVFRFRNPIRRVASHRSIIESISNPLHELRPVLFDGLCPGAALIESAGGVPGPAMIDLEPQPLTFELQEGETVTVRATRVTRNQQALLTPGLMPFILSDPSIEAALVIGGQNVVPQGSTSGPESISFTYTVR
jgi:hypothetical protein